MNDRRDPQAPWWKPRSPATGVPRLFALILAAGGVLLAYTAGDSGAADPAPISQAILLSQIDSLRNAGDLREALDLATAHLPRVRASGDSMDLLQLIINQGAIYAGLGEAQLAEDALRETLILAEAQRDTTAICVALRWLSVAVANQGGGAESREICTRLLEIANRVQDVVHMGWAHTGLGWEALERGQSTEALAHYEQALGLFEDTEQWDGTCMAWIGIARAHNVLGAYDRALLAFRKSVQIADRIIFAGNRTFILHAALNNIAVLEIQFGDPGEGVKYFHQAKQMALDMDHPRAAIAPWLNIALCLGRMNRLSEASDMYAEIVAACRAGNYRNKLGDALVLWALAYRAMERLEKTADLFRQALAMGDELSMSRRIEAAIGLAEVLFMVDSTAAASATLAEADQLLAANPDEYLQRLLTASQGLFLLESGRPEEALPLCLWVADEEARLGLSRRNFEVLSGAARACGQLGWPDSAHTLLERAASVWESDRGIPLDPEWREVRGAESREIYADLAIAILESPGGSPPEVFDRLQIFKARTLMERLRGPSGTQRDQPTGAMERLATVATLQNEILQPGELLLDTYLGPRASLMIAITPTECRILRLPSEKDLEGRLQLYHRILTSPPGTELALTAQVRDQVAQNLREDLFADVEPLLSETQRVLFAPDGCLNQLPLALLQAGEVVRVPSATFLTHLRMSDPSVRTTGPAQVLALGGVKTRDGRALPGAVEEVRGLAQRYRGVVTVSAGEDLSARTIPEILPEYEILHIAAHAEVNDRNPWRSAVMLDPDRTETWLYADLIAGLPLRARLAVLSSCATAHGEVISGEGVLSLCHAFLSAGVPAVVATLWPVDDRATVRFMEHFYQALSAGSPTGAALRRAQDELRSVPAFSHPYYWAGFTLVGLAETTVALSPRRFADGAEALRLLGLLLLLASPAFLRSSRDRSGRSQPNQRPRRGDSNRKRV